MHNCCTIVIIEETQDVQKETKWIPQLNLHVSRLLSPVGLLPDSVIDAAHATAASMHEIKVYDSMNVSVNSNVKSRLHALFALIAHLLTCSIWMFKCSVEHVTVDCLPLLLQQL